MNRKVIIVFALMMSQIMLLQADSLSQAVQYSLELDTIRRTTTMARQSTNKEIYVKELSKYGFTKLVDGEVEQCSEMVEYNGPCKFILTNKRLAFIWGTAKDKDFDVSGEIKEIHSKVLPVGDIRALEILGKKEFQLIDKDFSAYRFKTTNQCEPLVQKIYRFAPGAKTKGLRQFTRNAGELPLSIGMRRSLWPWGAPVLQLTNVESSDIEVCVHVYESNRKKTFTLHPYETTDIGELEIGQNFSVGTHIFVSMPSYATKCLLKVLDDNGKFEVTIK